MHLSQSHVVSNFSVFVNSSRRHSCSVQRCSDGIGSERHVNVSYVCDS